MNRNILLISLTVLLAACGVSKSDGVISRDANKSGFMGMSTTDEVVVEGEKNLASVNDVVIGSFDVAFNDSSIQKKQAKGLFGAGGFGGKATGKVRLEGIDDSTRQAITDAAYKDFIADLKAKGFNVKDRSVLTSSSEYQDVKKVNYPRENDESGMFTAYGKSMIYQPSELGSQGMSTSMGFANTSAYDIATWAKNNNIAVIETSYLVDFAAAGGHENMSTASVQVGQNLAVTEGSIKFIAGHTSTFNNGTPTVKLGQPIEAGETFGIVADETSTAMNVVQESVNVISALSGGGTSRSKNYVVTADPQKYKSLSVKILKQANGDLLSKAK